jgi:thiamine biosynthesis lipoprotein
MNDSSTTRRNFLRDTASLRVVAGGEASSFDEPLESATRFVTSIRRRAMACDWEVQLASVRGDDAMEHALGALDLVEALEDQMTVYRDDSEVIRINRQASDGPVVVEPRLFELLQLAQKLHRETDGAMDITSVPLSQVWGFSRRQGRLPTETEIASARQLVGMEQVVLDDVERTIAFTRPGTTIHLNCIGKGYALDRMAERLSAAGIDDYLLHGGKSSVLARGTQPGVTQFADQSDPAPCPLPPASSWTIGLRHPLRPKVRLAEFYLRDQALSTSGSGTQFFYHAGRRFGHILDPRTGWPVEGIHSVTVTAPTAAEADALSTAFYVMGPDKVAQYCAGRPEIAALFVLPSQRETDVRLVDCNLHESAWRQVGR